MTGRHSPVAARVSLALTHGKALAMLNAEPDPFLRLADAVELIRECATMTRVLRDQCAEQLDALDREGITRVEITQRVGVSPSVLEGLRRPPHRARGVDAPV